MIHPSQYIQVGDVVRNVRTNQRKVVHAIRPDMDLIAFEDSHLVGWSSTQGWVPTGEKAEQPA
jgi:hypothetical protein